MKMPYVLRTPNFDVNSGGIRVMYGLYGWLLAKGQVAFLNTGMDVSTVGIYPEIYDGNDMFSQKVIRYILQKPGMMGSTDEFGNFKAGPTSFDPKDELYIFSRVYDEWNSDDDHILFLPIIDLHTFKVTNNEKRTKHAFYVGKGVNTGKHPVHAFELKRGKDTQDQQALADYLNECEVLYVYDHLSAIMEVARLCGCKVIYLGGMPEEQLKLYEPGMNGLGYGKEVELNATAFRETYNGLIETFSKKLDKFIDHTQE